MYEYRAFVTKVYDGDTITVDIDLGFGVQLKKQSIRLSGINAPEVRGPSRNKGIFSRDWLQRMILWETVRLVTEKDKTGKYGRWLGRVYLGQSEKSLNTQMVEQGLAEEVNYK